MAPTSVRLSAAQEAELAALARDLPAVRPDLADAARGGTLTPGAVLRVALARGLRELRGYLAAPDDDDAPLVLDPGPPPLPPTDRRPPVRLDPWEPEPIRPPAGSPFLPAGAPPDDHARAWPAPAPAPAPAPPEPPAAPRGLVLAVVWEARGTAYRLTFWRSPAGSVGAAWPEGRRGGWAWGDLSPHAPPEPGWLAESGLPMADAREVAAALASRWGALTGAPVPHAPPAGALPGQALLPAYREPLR
jgi:hypothetical protein